MHADIEGIAAGRWPLFAPWLHTYALPIFAVLAVAVAVALALRGWLYEVEDYAERTIARARRILTAALVASAPRSPACRRRLGAAPPLRARVRVASSSAAA